MRVGILVLVAATLLVGVLRPGLAASAKEPCSSAPPSFHNSVAAAYGLQAGIQKYGYALFFMDEQSLANFESSTGFEIGVGPSIVVVDAGVGKTLNTTNLHPRRDAAGEPESHDRRESPTR